VEIALEICSLNSEGQVRTGLDQIGRGGEEGGGEFHGVTDGATHPHV